MKNLPNYAVIIFMLLRELKAHEGLGNYVSLKRYEESVPFDKFTKSFCN